MASIELGPRAAVSRVPYRAGLLAAVVLWWVGCGSGGDRAHIAVGGTIPGFSLEALDGQVFASSSLANSAAIVTFWATWCQPCLSEIPFLKQLAAGSAARVVAIALDEAGATVVRPFVESYDINYTVLLGDEEIFRRFDGFSIPYTLVLDGDQKIVSIYRGTTTREKLDQDLQRIGTV